MIFVTMSPTQRTLKYFRDQGAIAKVVERFVKFPHMKHGVRQDLWGADIQVIQGQKLLAVQTCAGSGHAKRTTRATADPLVQAWLRTGNGFEIWSWSKKGPRGKRKLWSPRVTQLTLNELDEVIEA